MNIRPIFFSPIRSVRLCGPPPRPMKLKRSNACCPVCQYNNYCCVARRIWDEVETEVDTDVEEEEERERKQKRKRVRFSETNEIKIFDISVSTSKSTSKSTSE